jgi:hypothetical protein
MMAKTSEELVRIATRLAREHYQGMDLGEEYAEWEIVDDAVDLMMEFYRATEPSTETVR